MRRGDGPSPNAPGSRGVDSCREARLGEGDGGASPALEPVSLLAGGVARAMGARLTTIEIAADRLSRRLEGREGTREIRTILEQSRGLAELARALLAIALPDRPAGRAVDLHRLLCDVTAAVAADMDARGIRLLLDSRPGIVAWGDPHQIRGALLALLANARKALEAWPHERLVVLSGDMAEGRAVIRVTDSGPGVSAGEEERILVPFVSGWGGVGMGLALSRIALLQQGGELMVERTRDGGGGATFTLVLHTREPERPEGPEHGP